MNGMHSHVMFDDIPRVGLLHEQPSIFDDMPEDAFSNIVSFFTNKELLTTLSSINKDFHKKISSEVDWLSRYNQCYKQLKHDTTDTIPCCSKGLFLNRYLSSKECINRLDAQYRLLVQERAHLQHEILIRKRNISTSLNKAFNFVLFLCIILVYILWRLPYASTFLLKTFFFAPQFLSYLVISIEKLCYDSSIVVVACQVSSLFGWIIVLSILLLNIWMIWRVLLQVLERVSIILPSTNPAKNLINVLYWRNMMMNINTSGDAFHIKLLQRKMEHINEKKNAIWASDNPETYVFIRIIMLVIMIMMMYIVITLFAIELNYPNKAHPLFVLFDVLSELLSSSFHYNDTLNVNECSNVIEFTWCVFVHLYELLFEN